MSKRRNYVELFSSLGSSWNLTEEKISTLEEITCHLYGRKSNDVDLRVICMVVKAMTLIYVSSVWS